MPQKEVLIGRGNSAATNIGEDGFLHPWWHRQYSAATRLSRRNPNCGCRFIHVIDHQAGDFGSAQAKVAHAENEGVVSPADC